MQSTSGSEPSITRNRLAWRKPAACSVVLALAIAGVLCLPESGRNPFDRSVAKNRGASTNPSAAGPATPNDTLAKGELQRPPSVSVAADRERAIAELTRQLDARQRSREARLRAAQVLAQDGTEAAMRILKETLISGSPELQQIVAEALGRCTNAKSVPMLVGLLRDASEPVVISAARSLSRQGTSEAAASLSDLLSDEKRSVDVRAEAALGLGTIARPEAFAALATAAVQIQDEAVASQVIRGIAGRSIEETRPFLETFLDSPNVSADLKAEALEGLVQAKGDPSSLLLNYAKSADSDLRAAAARALGGLDVQGNAGAEILSWLGDESNPLVRKRLYQALAHQESFDVNAAWELTIAESDPAVRVAGLDLLARVVHQNPTDAMLSFFDERALPELRSSALNGATRDERIASVIALRRLQTANANAALRDIAEQTRDPVLKSNLR